MIRDHLPRGLRTRGVAGLRIAAALGARGVGAVGDAALGEAITAELDQLKGLSMKVGQMLSTMDVGLPPGAAAVMARLQRGHEGLPLASFGADLSEFEWVEETPMAAASIAQVHRARLDGRAVAVKLRYPEIAAVLAEDLGRVRPIAKLASAVGDVDGVALVAELQARLLEECDLRWEAAWMRAVELPDGIAAPTVRRASEAMLVTDWIDGGPLDASVAADLFRLTWESFFGHGFLHADPHPGNFLVADRLFVLDWGAARRFTVGEVEAVRALARAVLADRRADARALLTNAGFWVEGADVDSLWDVQRWWWAPYLRGRAPLDPGWIRTGAAFKKAAVARRLRMAMPPAWVWINRVALGVHAAAQHTGVVMDPGEVLREALELPLTPMLPIQPVEVGREG